MCVGAGVGQQLRMRIERAAAGLRGIRWKRPIGGWRTCAGPGRHTGRLPGVQRKRLTSIAECEAQAADSKPKETAWLLVVVIARCWC